MQCRNCTKPMVYVHRGLCATCDADANVRDRFPAGRNGIPESPGERTDALPGTHERIIAYRDRAYEATLFRSDDAERSE